jgi:hypothetical protein
MSFPPSWNLCGPAWKFRQRPQRQAKGGPTLEPAPAQATLIGKVLQKLCNELHFWLLFRYENKHNICFINDLQCGTLVLGLH